MKSEEKAEHKLEKALEKDAAHATKAVEKYEKKEQKLYSEE